MSDLRPPSLRDTRNLTDVVRHHGLLLEKLAAGLFGGRSRIPDPLDLAGDLAAEGDAGSDGDTEEPEWWDEDRHIVAGPGTVTWTLTFVVIPESLFIRWHPGGGAGLPQVRTEDWTLGDDGQTVTIPDPDGIFAAGDSFSAQYQFLDVVSDDIVPVVYSAPTAHARSGTWSALPTSFINSQALPEGTQVGDLLIAVAVGEGGSSIGDSRMTTIATNDFRRIAIGYATDLTDMVCHIGGISFPLDQFAGIEIIAVHGDDGQGVAYDPAKVAISVAGAGAALSTISGAGHGAIMAIASGVINSISIDWVTYVPDFADWGGEGQSTVLGNFGYSSDNSPTAQNNPTNTTTLAAVIGLK